MDERVPREFQRVEFFISVVVVVIVVNFIVAVVIYCKQKQIALVYRGALTCRRKRDRDCDWNCYAVILNETVIVIPIVTPRSIM